MKSVNKAINLLFGAGVMIILILDAGTALQGASEGISLCINSVIPALFPFLVVSAYLTGNLSGISISFLKPLGQLCRIPSGSEGILLTGFLGGYPTGAQAVTQAYDSGILSKENARRMLGFCSNAGPAFLFGMLSPCFSNVRSLWILWGIHILSAIATAVLLPGGSTQAVSVSNNQSLSLSSAVAIGLKTMGLVCGWIIVLRVTITFLDRWILWLIPDRIRILVTGLLELTNGCVNLNGIRLEAARFVMASIFLNFGGVCVGMQTAAVTDKLGTGLYFPGKAIQCCVSTLLCGLILPLLYPGAGFPRAVIIFLLLSAGSVFFLCIRKNNSSNFQLQGV